MKCTRHVLDVINADNAFTAKWCHGLQALSKAQMLCSYHAWQSHVAISEQAYEKFPALPILVCNSLAMLLLSQLSK